MAKVKQKQKAEKLIIQEPQTPKCVKLKKIEKTHDFSTTFSWHTPSKNIFKPFLSVILSVFLLFFCI